ncbi:GIY-YIG nuclease family protein [Bermanella sp. WJH001]|uniref:GIY-YIG nuclease family protein n=1 Tax=Bermanella sp. WJH001 TaxID=3048005 RepID=UPI0024BDE7A1|nr:GIY-YIG nuclease family protein [Bermanella sp. WJH001]MDJ1537741.1 GIY-YIG nuclease family protein [Bermanella sp. WJH001]
MLVYTLTNNITGDVWVGTCKDSSDERFMQFQEAMALGVKEKIYKDLRDFGVENFTVEDYALAYDREELKDIFDDAMETYNGKSLIGVKTSLGKTSIAKSAPLKSSVGTAKRKTLGSTTRTTTSTVKKAAAPAKLATGRTGNAKKEKLIKEKLAEEKALRESMKSKQIMEQADEMAAIMARLDSRGSTVNKRR